MGDVRSSPLSPGQKSIERGSTFEKPRVELRRTGGPKSSGGLKRTMFSPASPAQRAKARRARFCLGCGRERSEHLTLDPAHLAPQGRGGCADALCTVDLCRAGDGSGCHRLFDDGRLDLLRVIADRWPEHRPEVQHMLEHMLPVEAIERLAGDRVEWRSGEERAA